APARVVAPAPRDRALAARLDPAAERRGGSLEPHRRAERDGVPRPARAGARRDPARGLADDRHAGRRARPRGRPRRHAVARGVAGACALRGAARPDHRDRPDPRSEPRADPPGADLPRPPHARPLRDAAGRLLAAGRVDDRTVRRQRRGREGLAMSISTFVGIETALRGLLAQQQALNLTGHNIANAQTPGYTRQTIQLSTTSGLQVTPGLLLGTGVNVDSYQRVRDQFLDVQLRAQTMLQGAADAKQDGLGAVEAAINEPSDSGINSLFSKYWA